MATTDLGVDQQISMYPSDPPHTPNHRTPFLQSVPEVYSHGQNAYNHGAMPYNHPGHASYHTQLGKACLDNNVPGGQYARQDMYTDGHAQGQGYAQGQGHGQGHAQGQGHGYIRGHMMRSQSEGINATGKVDSAIS